MKPQGPDKGHLPVGNIGRHSVTSALVSVVLHPLFHFSVHYVSVIPLGFFLIRGNGGFLHSKKAEEVKGIEAEMYSLGYK